MTITNYILLCLMHERCPQNKTACSWY